MQELVKKLTEQAGLSEQQANEAIEIVTNFIKEKLPPMMHGVVDNFLGKGDAKGGGLSDFLG